MLFLCGRIVGNRKMRQKQRRRQEYRGHTIRIHFPHKIIGRVGDIGVAVVVNADTVRIGSRDGDIVQHGQEDPALGGEIVGCQGIEGGAGAIEAVKDNQGSVLARIDLDAQYAEAASMVQIEIKAVIMPHDDGSCI